MTVSVILPTYRAEKYLEPLLEALHSQTLRPLEVIVIDSSSPDQTAQIARDAGCMVKVIPQSEFNHGATRNLGARMATGEVLVFMTQDALPAHEGFLEALVSPIHSGTAAAAYARQLPYPEAPPPEVFARHFNYPAQSHLQTLEDVPRKGFKAFFYSDVASAVRRETFWEMGGYPDWVIVDEDVYFCAKLLRSGLRVAYQAEAQVFHSHHYPLAQQFRRIFDVGVFVAQAGEMLEGAKVGGEGLRFVSAQVRYLARQGEWAWIPYSVLEAALKFVAYQMGVRHHALPGRLNRYLSQQKQHWARKVVTNS
ncbi:MAG: glycosyltransferase family 2 protein [Meiothermus sp.]|nr:glycosyltransferase family 2 protein [Meiothermus sp.]